MDNMDKMDEPDYKELYNEELRRRKATEERAGHARRMAAYAQDRLAHAIASLDSERALREQETVRAARELGLAQNERLRADWYLALAQQERGAVRYHRDRAACETERARRAIGLADHLQKLVDELIVRVQMAEHALFESRTHAEAPQRDREGERRAQDGPDDCRMLDAPETDAFDGAVQAPEAIRLTEAMVDETEEQAEEQDDGQKTIVVKGMEDSDDDDEDDDRDDDDDRHDDRDDATDSPFCTPQCILTLARGLALDPACPNAALHGSSASRRKHALSPERLEACLLAQLRATPQEGVWPLDCAPPFVAPRTAVTARRTPMYKIRLAGWGYTFVAKGARMMAVRRLETELGVLQRLADLQGGSVPASLGLWRVDSHDPRTKRPTTLVMPDGEHVSRLLGQSHGGWYFVDPRPSQYGARVTDALATLLRTMHARGVAHNDVRLGHVRVSQTGDLVLVGLGQATLAPWNGVDESTAGAKLHPVKRTADLEAAERLFESVEWLPEEQAVG